MKSPKKRIGKTLTKSVEPAWLHCEPTVAQELQQPTSNVATPEMLSAVKTLERLGCTHNGGEFWNPPSSFDAAWAEISKSGIDNGWRGVAIAAWNARAALAATVTRERDELRAKLDAIKGVLK